MTAQTTRKRFPGRNRKIIIGVIIVAVLSLALVFGLANKPNPKDKTPTQIITVTRGSITKSVATTGRVIPNFEVEIKGKASGKIIQLPYDVSEFVQQGALLVQLDPIDENREVSRASASLAGVESRMDQTRLNLQVARQNLSTDILRAQANLQTAKIKATEMQSKSHRLEELLKSRYISQEEYETGLTAKTQAVSELENANVRLRELKTQEMALRAQAQDIKIASSEAQAQRVALATSQQRLDETRIYAPISGVVTSRTGQIGQIVSSGISNVGGGTAIMTLADLSRIFVLASVDESDIGQVREGQHVEITADAFPGKTFHGNVVQIAPKGLEESNVVTFEVKIEVTGDNKQLLKPQMTANVEILIDRKDSALLIPADALISKRGETFVRVQAKGEKPTLRPVQTGINNGADVEIIQGLALNEKVIVGQGEVQSRWRRDGQTGKNGNMRGQRMMMRSLGGGRR